MSAEDADRLAKISLPAAIVILAAAVVVHALITGPDKPVDEVKIDGTVAVSHPNNIPVAAAQFHPEGGAIIRTGRRGWYRVYADNSVQYLGSDDDIGRR